MAKYYGEIGYGVTVETAPGVWEEVITTRKYSGDVIKSTRRYESSGNVNDNVNINNTISIVADPYAYEHCGYMKYISWMGTKWKITSVDIEPPRITLSIGGVYNG